MNISIESNARELQKKLSLFQKKHLGKATNDAINKQRNTRPVGGNTRPGADKIEFGK